MKNKLIGLICLVLIGCDPGEDSIHPLDQKDSKFLSRHKSFAVSTSVTQDPNILANSCRVMVNAQTSKSFQRTSLKFDGGDGSPVFLRPAALGKFLLFSNNQYITNVKNRLKMVTKPEMSSIWQIEPIPNSEFFVLGQDNKIWLGVNGLTTDRSMAVGIRMTPKDKSSCTEPPELSTNATIVKPLQTTWPDGSVYGMADIHTHAFANYSYGGLKNVGEPFNPLGVAAALPSCTYIHGARGQNDIFGNISKGGAYDDGNQQIIQTLEGLLGTHIVHKTDGYPTFSDWPKFNNTSHQMVYYKWLERAYLGGLRLFHVMTDNNEMAVLVQKIVLGSKGEPLYPWTDTASNKFTIKKIYELQDYVDAQNGGVGKGWFRIVYSPQQARDVIKSGKMAVVIGIESSNILDCYLKAPKGVVLPECTEEHIKQALDSYQAQGVVSLTPTHKHGNQFSYTGDGNRGFVEIGDWMLTGRMPEYEVCPDRSTEIRPAAPAFAKHGINADFGDTWLTQLKKFPRFLFPTLATITGIPDLERAFQSPSGDKICSKHGLTDKGRFLIKEMMKRGLFISMDHLARKSYKEVFDLTGVYNYPGLLGIHGHSYYGNVYTRGGLVGFTSISPCNKASARLSDDLTLWERFKYLKEMGIDPAQGALVANDMGFLTTPGPRFGPEAKCVKEEDPNQKVQYPFFSYDGSVLFDKNVIGVRTLDVNYDGQAHIGLWPDLLESYRVVGRTREEMEPLFRGAEAFIRTWEKTIERSKSIR